MVVPDNGGRLRQRPRSSLILFGIRSGGDDTAQRVAQQAGTVGILSLACMVRTSARKPARALPAPCEGLMEAFKMIGKLRERWPDFTMTEIHLSQRYRDHAKLEKVIGALRQAGLPN